LISVLLYKTADYIDLGVSKNTSKSAEFSHKVDRRRQRLVLMTFLMTSFVKFVMNPYPTLHDLNFILFFLLMNITFVRSYVEAFFFFISGIIYAIANTLFLWITWMGRFSGNANFFFFQVVALNAFLTLLFIQVFISVDMKRKKYSRQIVEKYKNEK